jgi:hypothetical protein
MITNKAALLNYIEKIVELRSPAGTGSQALFTLIGDVSLCVNLLLEVIESPENDPVLERLSDDFSKHLAVLLTNDLDNYPIAIEGLAQKFEAFLKKVGYFRYQGTDFWTGTNLNKGIKDAMLNQLIQGSLPPQHGAPRATPGRPLPVKLFNNSGLASELADFLRAKIRNNVHVAPMIERKDLIPFAEYVLVMYLLVIHDNMDILPGKFQADERYREKMAIHFAKWNTQYFHSALMEKEAAEIVGISPSVIETDWDTAYDGGPFVPKQGKILTVVGQVKRLLLIGDPGLGKTTTLQFLGYYMSRQAKHLPLYFPIKDFIAKRDLLEQIAEGAGLTAEMISGFAPKSNVVFLLDGTNEVLISADAIDLRNQLKSLLRQFPESYFIITTRPSAYRNDYHLPVFELQPLPDAEIAAFIWQNYPEQGQGLINSLQQQSRLRELCRNPLILVILCSIIKGQPGAVPANKGQILKSFLSDILKREQEKNALFDKYAFFRYLVYVGTMSRRDKKISFDRAYALDLIGKVAAQIDPSANRLLVLSVLTDLGLLQVRNEMLSFAHELYQEYLAAEGLKAGLIENDEIAALQTDIHWEQPFILYSGLISDQENFLAQLAASHPILAVKCLESTVADDDQLKAIVKKIALENFQRVDRVQLASESLNALLRLGESALVSLSLNKIVALHGKVAYWFLGQISSVLIKNIDQHYLIDSVRLVISLQKDYIPSVIRSLEKRDPDEIIKFREELFQVFKNDLFRFIKAPFVLRLFRLLDIKDADKVNRPRLERFCIAQCKLDYTNISDEKNIAWNLISHFNLFNDQPFLLKVVDLLVSSKNANHGFLYNIVLVASALQGQIIEKCLASANIASCCTGIYFIKESGQLKEYKTQLENNIYFQDIKVRRKLSEIKNRHTFQHKISSLFNRQIAAVELLKLDKGVGMNMQCRVFAISSKGVTLRIKGFRAMCKMLPTEIKDNQLRVKEIIVLRLAFIDHFNQVAYFTQQEITAENYFQVCKIPPIGHVAEAKILSIEHPYARLLIDENYPGIAAIGGWPVPLSRGKHFKVTLTSLEKGVYKAIYFQSGFKKVPENKAKTGTVVKKKHNHTQKRELSDFASLLENVLKK